MEIVVDTNIIFSILLGKNKNMRNILLHSRHQFYSPYYVFIELFNKKDKIIFHSSLDEKELLELYYQLSKRIIFINERSISTYNRQKAYSICQEFDESNTPIVAVALDLKSSVWTGDKKMKEILSSHGFDIFFESTNNST